MSKDLIFPVVEVIRDGRSQALIFCPATTHLWLAKLYAFKERIWQSITSGTTFETRYVGQDRANFLYTSYLEWRLRMAYSYAADNCDRENPKRGESCASI